MKLFFLFLGIAVWQDLRTRSISLEVLFAGAAAGLVSGILKERLPGEMILAMLPGIGLLFFSILTGGLIGEGDGWFFVVSGTFLGWQENLLLLICGQFFCGIFSLAMTAGAILGADGGRIRKMRLPFLPFLLPAAFWMSMMRLI